MANLKAIRTRIASVKNTRKITRAMKLVAAARLRKAQESITRMRPYALQTMKLTQVLMGQPQRVAVVIARALGSAFPRARYLVGYDAQALALAQSLTPTAVKDRVIRLTLGL